MTQPVSTKLSNQSRAFLKRLRNNRRKVETDEEDLSYSGTVEVIEKYFKLNNPEYIALVKLEANK